MPKTYSTFLGPATVHSQRFSGRSGKLCLMFPARSGGMQTLHAKRLASAREPNTWIWRMEGIKNLPAEQVIAPNCAAAFHSYLASLAEPTQ